MLVLRRRLAIAGITAVAAIAVPVAALASGPSSPPAKPAPPQAAAPSVTKPVPSGQPAPSSDPPPTGAAASKAAAAAGRPDWPAPIQAFAERLGVSTAAAGPAFKQVAVLAQNGGADPSTPAFTAIARELGVSPERLAAAWAAVGQDASGDDGGSQGAAAK
jgi:hypothetical protein